MTPYWQENLITLYNGDCRDVLRSLPAESVNTCVTSPPYWGLRDYGHEGQMGMERTPKEFIARMVEVFDDVRRVLRKDGTLWLNLGDSYHNGDKGGYAKDRVKAEDSLQRSNLGANFIGAANRQPQDGLKPKDLVGIPWAVAFALRDAGWYLRSDIIWHKPNPMPESITDRPTKSHEYLFLLSKSERYYYDHERIKEPSITGDIRRPYGSMGAWEIDGRPVEQRPNGKPRKSDAAGTNGRNVQANGSEAERRDLAGTFSNNPRLRPETDRNKRSVWSIPIAPYSGAHFATFPPKLIEPCILAGCPAGGTVLDPFFGAGTTGLVCQQQGVNCVGIELNPAYCEIIKSRLAQGVLFGVPA